MRLIRVSLLYLSPTLSLTSSVLTPRLQPSAALAVCAAGQLHLFQMYTRKCPRTAAAPDIIDEDDDHDARDEAQDQPDASNAEAGMEVDGDSGGPATARDVGFNQKYSLDARFLLYKYIVYGIYTIHI